MKAELSLQAISILVGREEAEGRIVFWRNRAVAVLSLLAGAHYDDAAGHWYLEAGFGPCADAVPAPFRTLADAEAWILAAIDDTQSPSAKIEPRVRKS